MGLRLSDRNQYGKNHIQDFFFSLLSPLFLLLLLHLLLLSLTHSLIHSFLTFVRSFILFLPFSLFSRLLLAFISGWKA